MPVSQPSLHVFLMHAGVRCACSLLLLPHMWSQPGVLLTCYEHVTFFIPQSGSPVTFEQLEAELLKGQKLQGVLTSNEVQVRVCGVVFSWYCL